MKKKKKKTQDCTKIKIMFQGDMYIHKLTVSVGHHDDGLPT